MSAAIFRDDSSIEDQRDAAIDRLMMLCPQPFRVMFRTKIIAAIDNTPPEELRRLMAQIDELQTIAATGDVEALTAKARDTARSFGASETDMRQLESMASTVIGYSPR